MSLLRDGPPPELLAEVHEFFPQSEWENALNIAFLESGYDAFAVNDTTSEEKPCGAILETQDNVKITAEQSIGYFQINSCNYPTWDPTRFYNCRHNVGTAHMLWDEFGWEPWFFSAQKLGLV